MATEQRTTPDDQPKTSRAAAWFWPAAIVGLLSMSLVVSAVTVYVAMSDPSFGVEEDYYTKAVNWDEHIAQDRLNERLGWSATFHAADHTAPDGTRELTLVVTDADGEPVDDLVAQAETFHRARRRDVLSPAFERTAPGEYTARVRMNKPGLWEVRLITTRGEGERFTTIADVLVPDRR